MRLSLTNLAALSFALFLPVTTASSSSNDSPLNRLPRQHIDKRGPGGWNSVTYPAGAVESGIPVNGGKLELFAMAKQGINKAKLKRIVFVIHGEGRDPWNYYSHMTKALNRAHKDGLVADVSTVGVWAPGFWCNADEGVWPASELQKRVHSNQLVWNNSDWAVGDPSIYPASQAKVSSFAAIDDAVRYFGNKAIFPNVNTIVLAGHSAGGQMLHRYAQLSNHPVVGAEVHYYIGNPASYLYLDDRRPETGVGRARSRKGCPTYNDYKYGLNNINSLLSYNSVARPNNKTLAAIYKKQFVHYQLGTADHASGTTDCEAFVQGSSHYNRGRVYQGYLEMIGYPKTHTIDYIEGVGHDDSQMFRSNAGMYRLFVENHAQGKSIPSAKDKTNGLNVKFTAISPKADQHMPGHL